MAFRPAYVALAIALVALVAIGVSASRPATAQGALTISFTDDSGAPVTSIDLPDSGVTTVQLHVSGLSSPETDDVNVAQVAVGFDHTVVSVTHACKGLFFPGVSGPGVTIDTDVTSFFCGIFGSIGDVGSGQVMDLTITRIAPGDTELTLDSTGPLATKLFDPGSIEFDVRGILSVIDTAATPTPTPTPVPPTPTPTAVPGGGGGGGGGFSPLPTPTPTPSGPVVLLPGAPVGVAVTPIVEGANLTWNAPVSDGGSAIVNYRVVVSPSGVVILLPPNLTSATINGLDPVISYQFQLSAVNDLGIGPSAGLTAPISPLVPLGAPQQVSASLGVDGRSAVVSWVAPAGVGSGPITGYIVTAVPAVGGGPAIGGIEVGPGARSVTVFGLESSTTYTFRVRAKNALTQGPLSAFSNAITTAGGQGAPGDIPGFESNVPGVTADAEELTSLGQAVSIALGVGTTVSGPALPIRKTGDSLIVEFPIESTTTGDPAGRTLKTTIGNLEIDILNGVGQAKIKVNEHVSITGSARLVLEPGSMQVQIENPVLTYAPTSPTSFSGAGGLVTTAGVEFGVDLVTLPGRIGLMTEFYDDVSSVPSGIAAFQLAAAEAGGGISNPSSDIAFVVAVNKKDVTNDDLGDNTVTLTVSRTWYEDRIAAGKDIVITKIGDDGIAYTASAVCEPGGDVVRCTVEFTGAAGGFSDFALYSMSSQGVTEPTATPAASTPTPVATPTRVATATPAPSPSAVPAATPTPAPTPTPVRDLLPTATPLSGLQATQVPPDDLPGIPGDEGGDGFPWAPLLIVMGTAVVLLPAAGGGYAMWRKKSEPVQ